MKKHVETGDNYSKEAFFQPGVETLSVENCSAGVVVVVVVVGVVVVAALPRLRRRRLRRRRLPAVAPSSLLDSSKLPVFILKWLRAAFTIMILSQHGTLQLGGEPRPGRHD